MNGERDYRRETLRVRKGLSEKEIRFKSSKIRDFFINKFLDRTTFFLYLSYNNEVDTYALIDELFKRGKRVAIPLTDPVTKGIRPIEINRDYRNNLISGYCAIPEPSPEVCVQNILKQEEIDLIVCPGSVFDLFGGRLGYGGGYYDRFLSTMDCGKLQKVALCYDFQVYEHIPQKAHDIRMNYLITESGIIQCRQP